jgi:hypothetical protein
VREAVGIAVLLVVLAVVLLAMRAGWRGRAQRSATLVPVLPQVPADELGGVRYGPVEGTYVSTTVAGDWLDRVVAHDLGSRSPASATVYDAGVLLSRRGARDVFLPGAALRGVSLAPGIAGKVVGGEGVVVLRWEAVGGRGARFAGDARGVTVLETGLRLRRSADRQDLVSAVRSLVRVDAAPDGAAGTTGGAA